MGIVVGYVKYVVGVLLSGTGFLCMYVFGGGIITLFKTMDHIASGDFIEAFFTYYVTSRLPPTSLEVVLTNAVVGAMLAGFLWFMAMAKRGVPL